MDPVQTEVMRNRFTAIVEEASTIAYRSAHTTFVKQTQDYQVALATLEGDIFAYPQLSGVTVYIGLNLKPVLDAIGRENLRRGDVIITNDPFGTEGMCTHTMDVHLIAPVFDGDQLIAVTWSFIHASDIGGAVPGSISPTLTEVFQEGIRFRPMKLMREGVVCNEVLNVLMDNCRIPKDVWGDLQAMIAAMRSMEQRMVDLCDRLGRAAVCQGMQDVMALAEASARAVIAKIPDGSYGFSDYLEGIEDHELTFITAQLTIAGEIASIDFTGTDPQVLAAVNFISGPRAHPFLLQPLIYYVLTVAPQTPINAGILRAMRSHAPSGTIVNAEFPAASGNRYVTVMRAYDVGMACLSQAVPGGVVACGAGQAGIIAVTARDSVTGEHRVNVVNPICGGSGARRNADGVDGVDGPQSFLRNTPVEVVEAETPMRIRQYRYMPDSIAAGRWRGGAAIVMDIENVGAEATMTVRGMNRSRFRAWGFAGGHPGCLGGATLNPGMPGERRINKITVLHMKRGDVIRLETPSGGGFGSPLEREPERVLRDVVGGWLTVQAAERDYGVVVRDGVIDAPATQALRRRRADQRQDPSTFDSGAERAAYDRIWPREVRTLLATRVLRARKSLRAHLLAAVRDRLTAAGHPVVAATLEQALAEEYRELLGPAEACHELSDLAPSGGTQGGPASRVRIEEKSC